MSKLYNNQGDLAINLINFFTNVCKIKLTKPQQKLLPFILLGMIDSESVVTKDIVKKLKGDFSNVFPESVERRIYRFFNNPNFDIYSFHHDFISHIIKHFNVKHVDKVHISFDHMYCKDKFTVLFLSLRIGKQGIPLWFKCFKGLRDPSAYSLDLIKEGINFVNDIFKYKKHNLIFLADRWFNYVDIMQHIDSLGHTYCIRLKDNMVALFPRPYTNKKTWKVLKDIAPQKYHAKVFKNIPLTKKEYITNIVISRTIATESDDNWIIATNGPSSRAIRDYSYRFGSIENIFKNQKSNGFYLETTKIKNLTAFSCMYGLMNIALTWLCILGSDYTKNKHNYSIKIRDTKKVNGIKKRIMSLFEIGLTLFNLAYNSLNYFKLKTTFVLYDL